MSTQPTNNTRKIIDKLSSISFFLSLVASKVQYIPAVTIATPFLNLITFGLSLIGYSMWYVASRFYPEQYPRDKEWYGFASFKEQNAYAAFLGIGAAVLSIVAISIPVWAIPAAWLFFSSNVVWAIGEYHKLKNPPADEEYSKSYQKSYLSYALAMTSVGLSTALSATAIFLFPLQTIPILAVSGLISIAMSLIAAEYWLNYNFEAHKKTPLPSYNKMSHGLGPTLEYSNTQSPEPYHSPRLGGKVNHSNSNKDEAKLEECDSPTCNLLW
ncbi:hypothetical protein [Legionella sp. km772]|uniref:hypothetical protein n=1 Tax=Legionella sp. km772 TaxID=2498111 RepID=UPI000F8E3C6F|nr:hypothetical protein [Legionella sp. km772]RUR12296.1 hypothetical protein ELY15_05495 [Legionella sp. km772]